MSTFLMPALALMVNALIFGISWWPFRELQGQGLHPLWATALTFVVSLTGLMLIRPGAWRGLLQYPMLWLLVIAYPLWQVGALTPGCCCWPGLCYASDPVSGHYFAWRWRWQAWWLYSKHPRRRGLFPTA